MARGGDLYKGTLPAVSDHVIGRHLGADHAILVRGGLPNEVEEPAHSKECIVEEAVDRGVIQGFLLQILLGDDDRGVVNLEDGLGVGLQNLLPLDSPTHEIHVIEVPGLLAEKPGVVGVAAGPQHHEGALEGLGLQEHDYFATRFTILHQGQSLRR